MDLKCRDAGQRPGRSPDLGGEVRQRREIVADQGGGVGEAAPGELHAIAGVAGEANDHALAFLDRFDHVTPSISVRIDRLTSSLAAQRVYASGQTGGLRIDRDRWSARIVPIQIPIPERRDAL